MKWSFPCATTASVFPRVLCRGFSICFHRSIVVSSRATGGLGIGLALVKGLTEMHGGTVRASSAGPGEGSTFTVRLPVVAAHRQPAEPDGDPCARKVPAVRRILVVDDSKDSAASLSKLLKLLGNNVRFAHDGLEALEVASEFLPEVILMDVGMPRRNGYEAARRIRAAPWGKKRHLGRPHRLGPRIRPRPIQSRRLRPPPRQTPRHPRARKAPPSKKGISPSSPPEGISPISAARRSSRV